MTFVQVMTFKTGDIDAARKLDDQWRQATEGKRTLRHEVLARDREHPGRYAVLAYFDSYEEAMRNSELPETRAAAQDFQRLSEEPMTFWNLEVLEDRA
ncbi:MAG TPA: hypothetical protein VF843_03325 [Streptosporangiaceae bacterium]